LSVKYIAPEVGYEEDISAIDNAKARAPPPPISQHHTTEAAPPAYSG